MATYKKRYKPAKEKIENAQLEDETIDVSDSTTAEVFDTLDETANKSEKWIEKNSKPLFYAMIGFVVLFLLYVGYQRFVSEPKQLDASNNLAYPRATFDKALLATGDEAKKLFKLGLDGTDGKFGFVNIADEYSGTKAGNMANYYAGISYLKLKEYDKAIEYLSEFDSDDEVLGPVALGAIGDAFADLNQDKDALEYYEKAGTKKENDFTSPMFLFKAGQLAIQLKDFSKAEKLFTTIKEKYPTSEQGREIDRYINMAKYGDASSVVVSESVKVDETPKQEEKVVEDVNSLYNATSALLGKTVKGYEYLGEFVSLKLKDNSEIIALSKGFESGLLNFIKSDAKVDKTTWFNLRRVLFKTGSADLDERSMTQIGNIVKILNAYPNVELKLGGYTDNTGNVNSNKKLSERRANAVLNALVSKGIDKKRLTAEGYGIEHPVADNNTEEGRALNRRVSARVTKK